MDISVIVPVYNSSKYLHRCFDSVISQIILLKNIQAEIIAINDCSPDPEDQRIIRAYEADYPGLFQGLVTHENLRQGGARNLGIKYAKGRYIYCVDADDFLNEGALMSLYSAANKNCADIAVCGYRAYKEEVYAQKEPLPYDYHAPFDFLPAVWCMMVKRELIVVNELFFPEKTFYEDSISLLWYIYSKKTITVSSVYYNWCIRRDSVAFSSREMITAAPKAYKYIAGLQAYRALTGYKHKAVAFCVAFQLYLDMCNELELGDLKTIFNYCKELEHLLIEYDVDLTDPIWGLQAYSQEVKEVYLYILKHINEDRFVQEFLIFQKQLRDKVFLSKINEYRNICLWGAGFYGREFARVLNKHGVPYRIVDRDPQKAGNHFMEGVSINKWEEVEEEVETVIVTALFAYNDVKVYLHEKKYSGHVLDYKDFMFMKRINEM